MIALGRDELVPPLGLREQGRQPQRRDRQREIRHGLPLPQPAVRVDFEIAAHRPDVDAHGARHVRRELLARPAFALQQTIGQVESERQCRNAES
jgi:hypothetical protein